MARRIPSSAAGILSYFTRHPTLANLLFVILTVAGLFAASNMRTQFFPDVVLGSVTVTADWEGASAEDIDRAIVQLLEPALVGVAGLERTSSIASQGRATITLIFEANWDMARAKEDVQASVDRVTELPESADDPIVRRSNWNNRVTDVVITGPVDSAQLAQYSDELVSRLFAAGVTRTSLRGVAAPQTLVEVPAVKLIAHDVTMAEIASAIAAEVSTDPAGAVSGANVRVRTGSEKRMPDEVSAIVLRANDDGSKLRVGDVATVTFLGANRERSFFVGDNPAYSLRVNRSVRGDAVGIQRIVEKVASEMEATLPSGVTIDLTRTRAAAIAARLDILMRNGALGLCLVVTLLFLFLNARTALWVAAGIPVAMLTAVAIMYAGGITINMISLFGLIITLGIVVDDAIVVGEHADHRARHYGEMPTQAAENAARRMAMPVFAATITTVVAFSGLVSIEGRFGMLIQQIPLTVIAVLAASLVECFLILPNHMAHALAAQAKERWYDWPSRQVNRGFVLMREKAFRPLMAGVILARYVVLAGVVVVLASQVVLFIRGDVQWRFFNSPERGTVNGNFAMVEGATREDTLDMMREMQRATETLGEEYELEYGRNPLAFVITTVGGTAGRGLSGVNDKDTELLGGISIELIDAEERPYSSFAFVSDLQKAVRAHPLVEVVSFRGRRSGPGDDSMEVRFYGGETIALKAASLDLQDALFRYPEVSAVQDSLAYDKEELLLDLTAQGQALGFRIDDLGRSLRNRLGGIEAATYPDGPRSAEIRVELPEGELTADFLERTQMRSPLGAYVPLADIVSVERRLGFSSVRRENGLRVISVTGDISEDDPKRATEIETALRTSILHDIAGKHQVEWTLAGMTEQENRFLRGALTGFIFCILGIYLVLAWVFASWSRPVVVMAIIPFGLVGAIYGHWVWDVPMSMFSIVGLLGMTGIIINDSIVLVTTIDDYAEDQDILSSIVDGAADRLRPVMLTTLTTVLGMLPLLYETSRQAQFLKPTIITLVYGLGFGMVLVLLVVPALIAVQQDVRRRVSAMRRAFGAPVGSVSVGFAVLASAILAWAAATLGATIMQGGFWGPLASIGPAQDAPNTLNIALVVFVAGSAILCCAGYLISALIVRRGTSQS
ncbi:MAG: efflux RND transporter permease subunit [Pseudomonadota bacterium]